ncbi:MAG: DUF4430 domain-containing protein [Oscillospiraceae bacterium]|nr:DUF4430 domain-containing protein [Oscillospiraceae bacterium]
MNKKTIIAIVAIVVIVAALLTVYLVTRPAPAAGGKTITVEIKYDEVDREVKITTGAETLADALREKNLIEGSESEWGLFITGVDGRTADDAKQEWWSITKDGEMTPTGADTTMIADGEHYELTLMVGYDF